MADLPAPVRVSPLIKVKHWLVISKSTYYITLTSIFFFVSCVQFGRWSLLTVGILYGAAHHSRLSKKEAAYREVESKQKVIRDAKLAAEKKAAAEKEIKELEALAK